MAFTVTTVETQPIEGQKTGTSGLRKKTSTFRSKNYLENWVQSLFSSLEDLKGATIAVGGDGRFFVPQAVHIILRLAAANGVKKVLVGQDGVMCTPGMSALIRRRKLYGAIILTASHNPGGENEDFGIKYNTSNGGPAPESVTDRIFTNTKTISEYYLATAEGGGQGDDPFAGVDLHKLGASRFENASDGGGSFEVEVVDSTEDYLATLEPMFDFDAIRALFQRPDFRFLFDAMHGVTGRYAKRLFVELLGGREDYVMRGDTLPDFGGGHPDPNLTYAKELVRRLDPKRNSDAPQMGAASDGDGDRNMILGRGFFVTPSDSLAIIAANARRCIPYFRQHELVGVARSMPTAAAVDRVAEALRLECHETPTGWKFFGNLLDAGRAQICGEESFGTGSDHIREKDGLFAVLCWLQILAVRNADAGKPLAGIESVVVEHWKTYGRNYFSRYDYEGVDADAAAAMMDELEQLQRKLKQSADADGNMAVDGFETKLVLVDNYSYKDPVDGSEASKQGLRFVFEDKSRVIFRLSGTGSAGATVRLYAERYEPPGGDVQRDAQDALREYIELAKRLSKLQQHTGRDEPTVIT